MQFPLGIQRSHTRCPARSVATRVFKTFLCDPITLIDPSGNGTGTTRRYLHDDLDLSCSSEKYMQTRVIAIVAAVFWPIGVPLLYALLLWASSDALVTGHPSQLSLATAFLSADYELHAFWWEPLEMCRKLILTGELRHLDD
jgi:hypothetical protein